MAFIKTSRGSIVVLERGPPTGIPRVSLEIAQDSDTPMELCEMATK